MGNKRISVKMLETIEAGFEMIAAKATIKSLSFNPIWAVEDGKVTNLIMHPTQRIIVPHKEIYGTSDRFQRPYVLIGTPYGMIVIYRRSLLKGARAEWAIEVCPMLVEKGFFESTFAVLETDTIIKRINDGTFFEAIELQVKQDNADGVPVWDGIPIPESAKRPETKKPHQPHKGKKPQKNAVNHKHREKTTGKHSVQKVLSKQAEEHAKIFSDGDHYHDPVTGYNYVHDKGRWKPLDVSVDESNTIVANGLQRIADSPDAADNTTFALTA